MGVCVLLRLIITIWIRYVPFVVCLKWWNLLHVWYKWAVWVIYTHYMSVFINIVSGWLLFSDSYFARNDRPLWQLFLIKFLLFTTELAETYFIVFSLGLVEFRHHICNVLVFYITQKLYIELFNIYILIGWSRSIHNIYKYLTEEWRSWLIRADLWYFIWSLP